MKVSSRNKDVAFSVLAQSSSPSCFVSMSHAKILINVHTEGCHLPSLLHLKLKSDWLLIQEVVVLSVGEGKTHILR